MTSLLTLAERLEKATAGSRELDDAILAATRIGWVPRYQYLGTISMEARDGGGVDVLTTLDDGETRRVERITSRPFSTSIDAALTLLNGDGWEWFVKVGEDIPPQAGVRRHTGVPFEDVLGTAATAALALCIASLRALAASADGAG